MRTGRELRTFGSWSKGLYKTGTQHRDRDAGDKKYKTKVEEYVNDNGARSAALRIAACAALLLLVYARAAACCCARCADLSVRLRSQQPTSCSRSRCYAVQARTTARGSTTDRDM